MSVVLPHTGLAVPHREFEITDLHAASDLSSYRASLSYRGRPVGIIEDEGRGGGASFRPLTFSDTAPVRQFAAEATRNGDSVSEEGFYDDLVREHYMERITQLATRRGQTLVRGFSSSGSIVIFVTLEEHPSRFTTRDAQRLAAETPQVERWEMWTGPHWAPVHPRAQKPGDSRTRR